jgi:hypothetical protein
VIGFNLDRRMFDVARCMPTVPGAIGAFRRAAIDQVGGVAHHTLAEDTDVTMAVIRAGWQVVYEPSAIAWTEVPTGLRQLWRQRYRWCYGTMQAMWKHRRALRQRGAAGRLGRRGLSYLLLFQILLPLTAPMVDVYAMYGLLFLPIAKVAAIWAGFTAVQVATAAYALHLDQERHGVLWALPLQQVVYRQLMYLVVVQSTVMALLGGRLGWHRMARTGAASAHAAAARPGLPGAGVPPSGPDDPPSLLDPAPDRYPGVASHPGGVTPEPPWMAPDPPGPPGMAGPLSSRTVPPPRPEQRRPNAPRERGGGTMTGSRWPVN